MSFLFDLSFASSKVEWEKQIGLAKEQNKNSLFDLGKYTVAADFRSYCGETVFEIAKKLFLTAKGIGGDIDGEYAFAFFDPENQEVTLARDWSGLRSLYYTIEDDRLIVGTNVYQVLASRAARKFSLNACAEFLAYEYVAEPKTLFENVFCVPRGKRIVINSKQTIETTGSSKFSDSISNGSDIFSGIRDVITQAHQKRLGSTNGVYLSGGIDSTVMAVTLKKYLGLSDVHSFTFRTKGATQDESNEAKSVADQLGLDYECITIDPSKEVDLFDIIERSNFPYPGAIMLGEIGAYISSTNLKGITMFAGQDARVLTPPYNIVDKIVLHDLKDQKQILKILSIIGRLIHNVYGSGKIGKGAERLMHCTNQVSYAAEYLFHGHSSISQTEGGQIAANHLVETIRNTVDFSKSSRDVFNSIVSIAWDRQHTSDMSYMSGITRSFGNECSLPFFDRQLNEFFSRIPMDIALKTSKGRSGHGEKIKKVNKFALREAYKNDLTAHMIYRDKAVCLTNHLYLNGCMSPYIDEFFHNPILRDTEMGQKLGLDSIYKKGIEKSKKWQMTDYESVVETHNLLFLEIIGRKYAVTQ